MEVPHPEVANLSAAMTRMRTMMPRKARDGSQAERGGVLYLNTYYQSRTDNE